jgi:transcriptional regulator with XRE-family HTH domain
MKEREMSGDGEGLNLGGKIRDLRERRRLTLQDLAAKTGLSEALLSEMEDNAIAPPVASLLKIARALGAGMAHFFRDDGAGVRISVTRRGDRVGIGSRPHHLQEGEVNYVYESLETKKPDKHMEPLFVEFLPMDTGDMLFTRHDGEEFVFVLEGTLEFRTDDRIEVLLPGDAIYFESGVNHGFRGLDGRPAKAVVVVWSR